MDCYDCKAKSVCAAVVQRGSVMCLMNRMRYCGTHAEEEPRRQQGDYCQYCGHRLREIGRERFCNNVNCRNRCKRMRRGFVGCEINPSYVEMAAGRISEVE